MNKLARAVVTLTSFSVVDRALGFVFKIYLSREMGAGGLGIYQVALSFFFVLMTLTTSGLPLISGKLTAAYDAKGMGRRTDSLVSAGLISGGAISLALIGLVVALRAPVSSVIGSEEGRAALYILLPSLLFCSLAAAFRGAFWGKERYATISVIELTEQIVRIALCVALFAVGMDKIYAAALSLAVAMAVSAVATAVCYFARGGRLSRPRGEFAPLLSAAMPISVLRASTSLVNSLMAVAVPFLFVTSGYTDGEAMEMFGATVGMAMPLLFLPITVIGSLSQAMIPALAKADAAGDKAEVRRRAETAIGFSVVVACVFLPLFGGLGAECGEAVYGDARAGEFLRMGSALLLPIALESVTSSMMNSLGMEKQGFLNYVIGSAVMFGVMFAFWGRFDADVLCLALFVSLTLSTALDVICIRRRTGISLSFLGRAAAAVGLALPCCFLASWTCAALRACPLLLAASVGAVVGCGGTVALYSAFGLMESFVAYGRKKSRHKRRDERKNICISLRKRV